MRRFDLRIHQAVRDKVPADALQVLSNRMLGLFDFIFPEGVLKANRLAEYTMPNKESIIVKVVVVHGKDRDGVTLTVPRPLAGTVVNCNECDRVGFKDIRTQDICPTCNGLGYLEKLPNL